MESTDSGYDDFELVDRMEASLSPEMVAEMQAWLQPTDYEAESSEFRRHLSSQAPGTGLWICQTPRFYQWHDSDEHGSLWIKGVPGAGKSVMTASVVEYLKSSEGVPVLFFFFRYIVVANRRPQSLARDWLAQLLPYSPRLQSTLQPAVSQDLEDVSDAQLWEYLLTGLSSVEKAYCVVDALDEMELLATDSFLSRLNSLATFRPGSIKLMMTSRPKQYLQSSLRDASIVHISLEQDLVGKDIAIFVSHRLKGILSDEDETNVRATLESTICSRSQGLFLYARLLLDQLIPHLRSSRELQTETLASTLPIGLEEMYNSMLHQQAKALDIDTNVQIFILECVTHSSRLLRLNELANVLEANFRSHMILENTKVIARTACAPLLEILEDETVQVIHHSFTEFLFGMNRTNQPRHSTQSQFPVLNAKDAHKGIAVTCLQYLMSGVLRQEDKSRREIVQKDRSHQPVCMCDASSPCRCFGPVLNAYDYRDARLRHPFLEYAVKNWAFHASNYDEEDAEFFDVINSFLDPESIDFRQWLFLEWKRDQYSSSNLTQAPSALHIAAFAGLTRFATDLLRRGQNVDLLDVYHRTPLHWACLRGHEKFVSLLLENGANSDPDDARGVKPLHEAARRNHAGIVELLLKAGVDPITPKTREDYTGRVKGGPRSTTGETAVEYASQKGHTETIMKMLPYLQPEILEEALCECCYHGRVETAHALLENSSVSPNARLYGRTALYIACAKADPKLVEYLLTRGADVELISTWEPGKRRSRLAGGRNLSGPPIHGLIHGYRTNHHAAYQQILKLLISAGASLESRNHRGETVLLAQIMRHWTRKWIYKTLLEAGADVSAVNSMGDNALHMFLRRNKELDILTLLFEYGATVEIPGRDGDTVLHSALSWTNGGGTYTCNRATIEYLLSKGALCDMRNDQGETALSMAVSNAHCSLEIFKILLKNCKDGNACQECLWYLNENREEEEIQQLIQELLSVGVSLESKNNSGQTVLLSKIVYGKVRRALLRCGARLDAVDSNGRGALHYHIHQSQGRPHMETFRELVEAKVNPLHRDNSGNNILHEAAKVYDGTPLAVELIKQIFDFGVFANSKNIRGQTPLHVHIEDGGKNELPNVCQSVPLLALFQEEGVEVDVNAQDEDGLTVLHLAAIRSEYHVSNLLTAGADPKILTKTGRSVLHLACRARKSSIVVLLLDMTGNVLINKVDSFGRTALHDACTSGRPESVYYLLKSGADISIRTKEGRTPLHSCAEFSTEQQIWSNLLLGSDEAGQVNRDRFRPDESTQRWPVLWYTSEANHLPPFTVHDTARIGGIVRSLLDAGAEGTATDSSLSTPLDLALAHNCTEMIRALKDTVAIVQESRKFDAQSFRMFTELSLRQRATVAAYETPDVAIREILKHPSRYLSLLDLDDIDWIITRDGDISGIQNDFNAPSVVYLAAERGLTEVMKRLRGLAQVHDKPSISRALLQKLEAPYHRLRYAQPTLHVACKTEIPNIQMLEILLDTCGVDINARCLEVSDSGTLQDGATALHRLAEANFWWQLEAIEFLIRKGADINSRNGQGESPLHVASRGVLIDMDKNTSFWRVEAVRLLLKLGADPNVVDTDGRSCLHKAGTSAKIMQILLENGADPSIGTISPVFAAIECHDLEALKMLLDLGVSPDSAHPAGHYYQLTSQKKLALLCASLPAMTDRKTKEAIPLIKLLIDRGADIYAPLNNRETLIHYIFEHAEYEVVCTFMEYGRKINFEARDQFGRSILLAACSWKCDFGTYKQRNLPPVAQAPALMLLGLGVDIMAVDHEGRNALHYLLGNVMIGQESIFQFLKYEQCKALIRHPDAGGYFPLHSALETLVPAVCEAVLDLGGDLMRPDPTGATALHYLASQFFKVSQGPRAYQDPVDLVIIYKEGCHRLWQKYLNQGGEVNARDNKGSPPLFYYMASKKREYLFPGCEPSAQIPACCHAIEFAALFENADIHAKNNNGETALHIVARKSNGDKDHDKLLFEFLIEKGLDPLTEDGRGRSSLDVAAACEKRQILELFQYRSQVPGS